MLGSRFCLRVDLKDFLNKQCRFVNCNLVRKLNDRSRCIDDICDVIKQNESELASIDFKI